VLAHEGIAFEIGKNVAGARFGKAGKPEPGFHRQQLELAFP